MSARQMTIAALAAVVIMAFFVTPWVQMTGFLSGDHTGFDLAKTTESAASGNNLVALWATPLAALGILLLALPFAHDRVRIGPIVQIVLAAVAVLPPILLIPDEISYWSGGETSLGYGLWLTFVAMALIAIIAALDQVEVLRHTGFSRRSEAHVG